MRNIYKIVESDSKPIDTCAWWYNTLKDTLWQYDEDAEAWIQILRGNGSGGIKYILPAATANSLGGIKVGNGLVINNGVLSVAGSTSWSLPRATSSTLGGIKVGDSLRISVDGVLNTNIPTAGSTTLGLIQLGYDPQDIDEFPLKVNYEGKAYVKLEGYNPNPEISINPATTTELGGFKLRTDINDLQLNVQLDSNYGAYVTLPVSSAVEEGVIKVGYTQVGNNYPVMLDSNNRAYVNVPTVKPEEVGVKSVEFTPTRDSGEDLGSLQVDGTYYPIYSPIYSVEQQSGLTMTNYQIGTTLAGVGTFGKGVVYSKMTNYPWFLKDDEYWEKTSDEMMTAMKEYGSAFMTDCYINEGVIQATNYIQAFLLYKWPLTFKYFIGATQYSLRKDVNWLIQNLYQNVPFINKTTGKIMDNYLPGGFVDEVKLCYMDLNELGKGHIYEDSEHTTEITPLLNVIYIDALTDNQYRYVTSDEGGEHLFAELSRQLIYYGNNDNVTISSDRVIDVQKTTSEGDIITSAKEVVRPVRYQVQRNNSIIKNYTSIKNYTDDTTETDCIYWDSDSLSIYQKVDGQTLTKIELDDNDPVVYYENIFEIPEYSFYDMQTNNGRVNILSYKTKLSLRPSSSDLNDDTIYNVKSTIKRLVCADDEYVDSIVFSLQQSGGIPEIDIKDGLVSTDAILGLVHGTAKIPVIYKAIITDDEIRVYDQENYYTFTTRKVGDSYDTKLAYQRPMMEVVQLEQQKIDRGTDIEEAVATITPFHIYKQLTGSNIEFLDTKVWQYTNSATVDNSGKVVGVAHSQEYNSVIINSSTEELVITLPTSIARYSEDGSAMISSHGSDIKNLFGSSTITIPAGSTAMISLFYTGGGNNGYWLVNAGVQ